MAKLYFRYGAMNSGKSTALMQVAHNYEEQGMQVLILKPQVDTKGGGELVSRLGVRRKADLLIPPEADVFEAVRAASQTQKLACVLCDESQFFTPAQAEQLFMVTVDLNIPVICYGLRSDFSLKGFPGSTRLLELAHTIEEMKTICTCGRKATCNCRKVNGVFVFEGEQVAIDLENDVQYVSMCPQCYFRERRAFYARRAANYKAGRFPEEALRCVHFAAVFPKKQKNFFSAAPPGGAFFCPEQTVSDRVIYQLYPTSRVYCAIDISVDKSVESSTISHVASNKTTQISRLVTKILQF